MFFEKNIFAVVFMFVCERIYLLLCLCLSKTILAIFNGFGVYGFIPYKGVTPLPPVANCRKKYHTIALPL